MYIKKIGYRKVSLIHVASLLTAVLSRFDFLYPPDLRVQDRCLSTNPKVDSDGDLVVFRKKDLHHQEGVVLIGKYGSIDIAKNSCNCKCQKTGDVFEVLRMKYQPLEVRCTVVR